MKTFPGKGKAPEAKPPRVVDQTRSANGHRKIDKVPMQTTITSDAHAVLTQMSENLGGAPLNFVVEIALYNLRDTMKHEPDRFGRLLSERMLGHGAKNGHDSDPGASGEARDGSREGSR